MLKSDSENPAVVLGTTAELANGVNSMKESAMKQSEISRSELSDDLEKIFETLGGLFPVDDDGYPLVTFGDKGIEKLYGELTEFAEKYAEDNFFDR
jgi:hypothetical protein